MISGTFHTKHLKPPFCLLRYSYACAIALRFSEKNIRKYVQPFLLTLPIAMGLWIAAPPLFHELYNPPTTTMSCAWCYPTTYPDRNFCADNSECILRGKEAFDDNKDLKILAWLLGFIIIAISIGLVVLSLCFRSNPKLSYTEENRWNDDFDTDGNRATPSLSMLSNFKSISTPSVDMSRVLSTTDNICTDALSPKRGQFYSFKLEKLSSLPRRDGPRGKHKHDDLFDDIGGVSALQSDKSKNLSAAVEEQVDSDDAENESTKGVVDDDDDEKPNLDPHPAIVVLQALTYISIYAVSFMLVTSSERFEKQSTLLKLWLAFFPLHGFFNMIIFLSHKVYNYRRVHTETTVGEVISLLFTTNVQEPCFVERISIVNDYHLALSRGHNEAIQVSNEMGDRVFVRRSLLVQLAEGQPDRSETDENENYGGNIELPPVTTSQNSNSERYFVGSGSNLDISNAGISAGRSSALSGFSSFAGFLSFGSSKSAHTKSRDNDVAKKERNEVQCD